ncbi:MAG: tetratricopeptide repeat protein [bacterium]
MLKTKPDPEKLIPEFILRKYHNGKKQGSFRGLVLYVDVSGFSEITNYLLQARKKGVQKVSEILNEFYHPFITAVYAHEGTISCFEGDSFIAIFPFQSNRIISLVKTIYVVAERSQNIKEKYLSKTDFGFHYKIGLSIGTVKWKIVRTAQQNFFLFQGKAVDQAISAGKRSIDDHFVVTKGLTEYLTGKRDITLVRISSELFQIKIMKSEKIQLSAPDISEKSYLKNQKLFLPVFLREIPLHNEFRNIITCFVSPSSSLDPDEFIVQVNKLSEKFGGLTKFSYGDKGLIGVIMFGAPRRMENSFQRATDLALHIVQNIPCRIGISSGSAFTGLIGNKYRSEYVVFSDKVNLSSRLMDSAGIGQIIVDDEIAKVISPDYKIKILGNRRFKGFDSNLRCWIVEGKKLDIKKDVKKIVNLHQQRKKLFEKAKQFVRKKKREIIYISGEPGTGKTILLNHFLKNNDLDISAYYLKQDYAVGENFNILVNFLSELFLKEDHGYTSWEKVFNRNYRDFLAKVKGSRNLTGKTALVENLQRNKPYIANILSLPVKSEFIENLEPEKKLTGKIRAIANIFRALCYDRPVVIILEDIHVLDSEIMEIISKIIEVLDEAACCFIFTTRDELKLNEKILKNSKQREKQLIKLNNLGYEDASKLIQLAIKATPGKNLIDYLYKVTQGNPYFIETYCDYLLENSLLIKKKNKYYLSQTETKVPTTIQDLIAARIDRLDSSSRDIFLISSVYQGEIDYNVLKETIEIISKTGVIPGFQISEVDFFCSVQKLIEKNIFKFVNSNLLIPDNELLVKIAYNMLLDSDLIKYHRIAAGLLEKNYGSDITRYSEIASHFEKGNKLRKASFYYEQAANYAQDNYLNKRAIQLYYKVKNCLRPRADIVKKAGINLKLIEVYEILGNTEHCKNLLSENINLCLKFLNKMNVDSEHKQVMQLNLFFTYIHGGYFKLKLGKYSEAVNFAEKAMDIFKLLKNDNLKSYVFILLGRIYYDKSNYKKAIYFFNKSVNICQKYNDEEKISRSLMNLGNIYSEMSDYTKAINIYKQALSLSEKNNNLFGIAGSMFNIAYIHFEQRDFKKAETSFLECLKIFKKFGETQNIAKTYLNLGLVSFEMQKFKKSNRYLRKSLNLNKKINNRLEISRVLVNLGNLYYRKEKFKEAEQYYQKASLIKDEIGDIKGRGILLGNMGIMFRDKKKYKKAEQYLNESLKILSTLNAKFLMAHLMYEMLKLYDLQRNYNKIRELYKNTLTLAEDLKLFDLKSKIIDYKKYLQ